MAELMLSLCNLAEAEGRILRINIRKTGLGCMLTAIGLLFCAAALVFGLAAFYYWLAEFVSSPAAFLIMAAVSLVCGALIIWIAIPGRKAHTQVLQTQPAGPANTGQKKDEKD